jgi:hypothetical protein
MTTAGTVITKANIVEAFKAMSANYNAGIVWHSANSPFTPNQENTYNGVNNDRENPASGSSSGFDTSSIENNITTADVRATITNQFASYASALSRIRRARLIKYYSTTFPTAIRSGLRVDYDETNITSLGQKYGREFSGIFDLGLAIPQTGTEISASKLNSFVSTLSTGINNHRNSTVTFEEFYCHSSCHSNCHGSI